MLKSSFHDAPDTGLHSRTHASYTAHIHRNSHDGRCRPSIVPLADRRVLQGIVRNLHDERLFFK